MMVQGVAARLNDECFCITTDRDKLLRTLQGQVPNADLWRGLATTHPHLFAASPSFVSHNDLSAMQRVVQAVERIAMLPAYQCEALAYAGAVARRDFGPRGVFMGYDFHITAEGPKLIEINTNAGGAFLNAVLQQAQQACCQEIAELFAEPAQRPFAQRMAEMFRAEWRLQARSRPLQTIAIVDDNPSQQYLYPEFVLAAAMLRAEGIRTVITDPRDLNYIGGVLRVGEEAIDLVYNRLVDFSFSLPGSSALQRAYAAGAVVVTPSPRHHALFANKRNLTVLSDPAALTAMGATAEDVATLVAVPRTVLVSPENADQLWENRKALFFKPLSGHGGKAVYKGDKLTRKTWARIISGGYVAQDIANPGHRTIRESDATLEQKMDVRLYTYGGDCLIKAARLYRGQTTNFRTPGGGFSPLYAI